MQSIFKIAVSSGSMQISPNDMFPQFIDIPGKRRI